MNTIHFDSELGEDARREGLYDGQLFACIQGLLRELGCDLERTYFECPA